MPTYRSTDFDVHRNWLAVTHNLPLSEWYFDDVNGTTVHTLDYPPMFAYFEAFLSNNPLTARIIPQGDRCLELLPDSDNTPSEDCIVFHRSTVILSDLVFWAGAYIACRAMHSGKPLHLSTISFLLVVWNPGLLWLDHIHFQYNGWQGIPPANFTALASVTAFCLVAPWILFLLKKDPKGQLLFPFGRGLVHDYWAANVWALYLLADKVIKVASSRLPRTPNLHLPEPTPLVCAVLMFVSQLPALAVVATRKRTKSN